MKEMLKALAGFWLAFNAVWLLGLFVLIAINGSVIVSESRTWLAWTEVVLCFIALPALVYLYNNKEA